MKFGEAFTEYLHNERERYFLEKCSHVEYKRLKKVLKTCQTCKTFHDDEAEQEEASVDPDQNQLSCQCQSCPVCDQTFFSELMKEASDIAICFNLRARHLLHLHVATGIQRYLLRFRQCFMYDQQAMVEEGRMLIEYATMNALAIRKILKKYDKVHCSENGKHFKSKLQAEHVELLQSPWLIELGAFYLNLEGSDGGELNELSSHFSCDLDATPPIMALILPDSLKMEYDLTCAICLETVFNPYALSCGHLFCKSCACSAASVFIFQGPKAADSDSKCPICRETGVYAKAVHMLELDLLLKRRCRDYWKERYTAERTDNMKQTKEFWDLQAKYALY
ncbi:putative transcription factor C2H2 family [Rosa chinensis]|uniref:RING-type E3 ubiquitin transferase n=1 Tax=Rosa chinensis TaxID=74649 RepID=A0A2P6RD01_ROSCH|nr:probable E3 ubiquitin-protein ligase BAH1-like [Rosa chinensis]PRQ44285.1 putative transcription factor C2H2 family [Rosa chinensis]